MEVEGEQRGLAFSKAKTTLPLRLGRGAGKEGVGEAALQSPMDSEGVPVTVPIHMHLDGKPSANPATILHKLTCCSISESPHVLLSFLVKLPLNESDFTVSEPAGPNHGLPTHSPHSSQRDALKIQP